MRENMAKQTALVVDDSSTIRTIIQRELVNVGYEVIAAENGMEALAMIEWMTDLPDIITLDIDMPVMGGFEVCERLRAGGDSPNERKRQAAQVPIIFVSANDNLENRRRGYQLEIIDFISKPFSPGDITQAVDKVLNPKEQFPGMRALVVDDSASVRRIIRSNLNRSGVEVIEASDGHEALALAEQVGDGFDIIIIDHLMPKMNGDELCRRLSKLSQMEQVPKFFISSLNDKESILAFFKAGASDYLKKPFIAEELHARLETHLRVRKYVKQLEILNKKLGEQATHDGLTGLYNRRYFQEAIERIFSEASRYKQDLSCVMLDLDYFKKVNDSHGHPFGDLVLKEFAGLVAGRLRKADIAARYGGEEFILFLPNTGADSAAYLAESIREKAEKHCYSDGITDLQVTCSSGVSSMLLGRAERPEDLLAQADEALYRAKERGRNRVEIYGREETIRFVKMGKAFKSKE
jgi:two-component system cell cycle response regulator